MKTEDIFDGRDILTDVNTPSPADVAMKHCVPVKKIVDQLRKGIEVEFEHTKNRRLSREIALDHLNEMPDYYTRLARMEQRAGLKEDEKPTRTKDKTSIDFEDPTSKGEVSTTKTSTKPERKVASRTATQQKTQDMRVQEPELRQAFNHMRNLVTNVEPEDDGYEADIGHIEVEPTTENLPSVINKDIARLTDIEPEWSQVKDLPGMIQQSIRTLGRHLFKQFTDVPIEDVQVLATLIDPEEHVKAAANWIKKNATHVEDANIDFSQIMPGYDAKAKLFRTKYYDFLIVKDFMGHYIYSWESSKKIKESASAGSTSAGSIASVSNPLGNSIAKRPSIFGYVAPDLPKKKKKKAKNENKRSKRNSN